MDPEAFRQIGHQLIDWIADYRAKIADFPVMSRTEPGEVRAQLPDTPPESPESFASIFRDLEQIILPGLSHWQHPNFYGYFPANATLASVLGDYLSTGLGVLGLSWQSSPALSELEEVVTDWMRQMVGLSANWSGVIQDTASTSTLLALLCARERTSHYSLARGGLQSEDSPLVVYASDQSHSSVEKAALLAGFGKANVRIIPTDGRYAMRTDALAAAVEDDLSHGLTPCAVVATIGTTATTALDPLEAIAQVTRKHDLWLHVDTALAGSAMILPECRWMWQGIEKADSLVINAHKWLGVVFDCSLYYVRDPEHLIRVMGTNPSFLQSAVDDKVKNLRDWGIPLGRRFRALKLWCLIREQGVAGLQARLRRDISNAQWLAQQIEAAPNWRVLAPVTLQTVCVRHEPPGLSGDELDQHTLAWVNRANASGEAYLTPAILADRWMVRVSIGALPTEREHVAALWALIQREAARASTRNSKWIKATPEALYQAFTDPTTLAIWLAPGDMTGEVHRFDGRVGGGYQMSLYYSSTEKASRGKTREREDRYTARFVELTPPRRIVEAITFDSVDPAFSGEMIMMVTFKAEDGGTTVEILFKDIPSGILPEDNETGTQSTLEKLARFVE